MFATADHSGTQNRNTIFAFSGRLGFSDQMSLIIPIISYNDIYRHSRRTAQDVMQGHPRREESASPKVTSQASDNLVRATI